MLTIGVPLVTGLLRQMEFDADRHEVAIGGSKSFAETSKSLRLLGLAHMKSMYGLRRLALKEAVLVDDIPLTVSVVRDQLHA